MKRIFLFFADQHCSARGAVNQRTHSAFLDQQRAEHDGPLLAFSTLVGFSGSPPLEERIAALQAK
ncbi:hypothetical protein H206_02292 [Candidatus Electrothrix aarhusensis]|uniref:Uncharacterized protein n=1 Tax=Candidatus Electrothrix aarhusensis TaxID=1859131 RepID=A0A3S3RSB8_9BACT|nr:hypothetical protein H206_02292 [Candidatus Electrothrix aarhusensis]